MTDHTVLLLRPAAAEDVRALRRLAELDSAAPLRAPVHVAIVDGDLIAAVSLADGRAVADPFRPTADVLAVLREHAGPPPRAERRRRIPRRGSKALRVAHA
jgi:hypothetical protein